MVSAGERFSSLLACCCNEHVVSGNGAGLVNPCIFGARMTCSNAADARKNAAQVSAVACPLLSSYFKFSFVK